MKTTINLKLLLGFVFIFNLHTFVINQQSSTLYAQNPDLFENTWYLHNLVIDGDSYIPPVNDEIPFVPADFYENGIINTGMCEESGTGELEYIGTTEFDVLNMAFLTGGCYQNHPHNQEYSGLYQQFWSNLLYSYEITKDGQNRTLIITSPNGDYAIFGNEAPLSIDDFTDSKFLIYPNPVKETVNINNSSNQTVTVTIYDVSGKKLQTHTLKNKVSTINVKALRKGLYFVVFENEAGERSSERFIKK